MQEAVRIGVDLFVFAAYWMIGARLTHHAYQHLIDRSKGHWLKALGNAADYKPEGEPLRVRAVRYWWAGGLAVIAFVTTSAILWPRN